MMGVPMKQLWLSSVAIASLSSACGSSKTVEQINTFADKVCACQDAACATSVQTEYLDWWGKNQRARGSEGDRKDVEKAMQRYAKCHLKLAGPEPVPEAPEVPKVDLNPAPAPEPAPAPAAGEAAPEIAPKSPEEAAPAAEKKAAPTP
jgi:hypothetical protein